jgi:hypothetical protein
MNEQFNIRVTIRTTKNEKVKQKTKAIGFSDFMTMVKNDDFENVESFTIDSDDGELAFHKTTDIGESSINTSNASTEMLLIGTIESKYYFNVFFRGHKVGSIDSSEIQIMFLISKYLSKFVHLN